MGKYCIVPQKSNMFRNLVEGMSLKEREQSLLDSCQIKHVEISPSLSRWEILLQAPELVSGELLSDVSSHICRSHGLKEVLFYQDIIQLEQSVEKAWPQLAKIAAGDNPSVFHMLRHVRHRVEEGNLLIEATGNFNAELLKGHGVPKGLADAVFSLLGLRCRVECIAVDADIPVDESLGDFQCVEHRETVACQGNTAPKDPAEVDYPTPTYMPPAPHPAKARTPASTASAPKNKKNAPSKGKDAGTGKPADLSAPVPIVPPENRIFGKDISGDSIKIGDIGGEQKNVTVEGIIGSGPQFGIKTNSFKTGTQLLSFCISDDTDGISCKKFFKSKEKEEIEQAVERLCEGMEVKIHGSVRFDTFMNEYVLFMDSIEKKSSAARVDNAPEKRVELHMHTTMSMMDAVTPVKTLIKTAASWGWPAIAITDHGVVQAFPDADKAVTDSKLDIKIIYGMEGYLTGEDYEQKHANHIIILAKNPVGLRNLYRLVSLSHLKYYHRQPRIPKKILEEYREGLILGSACEAGELIRAIVAEKSDEELLEIASFYDYLEIQPIHNNDFLKRSNDFPNVNTDEDLMDINLKVADLAKRMGKMLVATCDVHFMNKEDAIYREIILTGRGFDDAAFQPPLFLRTTEEMLSEFEYLGEELAYEAVVTNPRLISESVERFKPIPDGLYSPMIPGADDEIRDMSYRRARELYGENLPEVVEARLEQELKPIIGHGFSVLYLISQRLVKKSNDDGYLVGSRGSVGSSFIATMTGITEVNPLPPHWRCPKCQYSKFIQDGSVGCGYDLPDRDCPVCGTKLVKDGHDIPFAVFLGFDGDKVPDIDLNFSGTYQPTAHKYTEILFGKDNVYRAGTIATVADKTAYGYVMKYYEGKGEKKHRAFIDKVVAQCMGAKRTTGQHPAGIMVVPRNMDVHFFTPIQHPADKDLKTITTHFDYHSISSRLVKLDILGHDDPTVIKMLEDLTHRDPKTIPLDDKATLSLFSSTEALGVTPEELGANSGTFGIPEFRTGFTRQMIDDTHPDCFSDLVRISGFSHGTDVWLGNAQDLIKAGTCTLKNAISARDDIMMYLIHHGIDPLLSFKTMEGVRKGKGIKPDVVEVLRSGNVPEWYIESCQKIKYLFPRAHATAYVMMAYRIAFCKVHYPLAYYAAYFTIRAAEFDADVVARGKDFVGQCIKELEERAKEKKLEGKDSGTLAVLQLAWEMYLRGYSMERVDIYRSDAEKFIILEKSLLPPLASLGGMGKVAAHGLADARKDGEFTSVDDLRKRSGISKTNVEILRSHGCLEGMDESDQIALFGIA